MSRTTCFVYEEDVSPQLLQAAHAKNNNIIFFVQYNSNRPQALQVNYLYAGKVNQVSVSNNPKHGNRDEIIARELVFRNIIAPQGCDIMPAEWLENIFMRHQAVFSPDDTNIISPIRKSRCHFLKPPVSPASPLKREKTLSPRADNYSPVFFEPAKPTITLREKPEKKSKFDCMNCIIS